MLRKHDEQSHNAKSSVLDRSSLSHLEVGKCGENGLRNCGIWHSKTKSTYWPVVVLDNRKKIFA
jgi:hypothetical protein